MKLRCIIHVVKKIPQNTTYCYLADINPAIEQLSDSFTKKTLLVKTIETNDGEVSGHVNGKHFHPSRPIDYQNLPLDL